MPAIYGIEILNPQTNCHFLDVTSLKMQFDKCVAIQNFKLWKINIIERLFNHKSIC